MSMETPGANIDLRRWHFENWRDALKSADTAGKLAPFNDVISSTDEPTPETAQHVVLQDVSLGGKICDVYHFDQDKSGNMIPGSSAHRVFVHIKK